jgi:hypothetical protein
MNREDEITKASLDFSPCFEYRREIFIKGAKWADEHPSWKNIIKVWNLATKTAIAQINRDMPYFKSEKEIKEFINKKLNL